MRVQLRRSYSPTIPPFTSEKQALAGIAVRVPGQRTSRRHCRSSWRRLAAPAAALLAVVALLGALDLAPAAAQLTPAGTIIDVTSSLDYRNAAGMQMPTVLSNVARVTVGQSDMVSISPASSSGYGGPGEIVDYAASVTNVGAIASVFNLSIASAAYPAWPIALYADDGAGGGVANDGVHQPGEGTVVASTGPLAPGASFNCFVTVIIPGAAVQGATDTATLTASLRVDPTVSATAAYTTRVIVASLSGQVTDRLTGDPLIGATVNVYRGDTWTDSTLTMTPWGIYAFGPELPPGTYRATASYPGYTDQSRINVTVGPGMTAYVNFFLTPEYSATSATVMGQITDAFTGDPLSGATVLAFRNGVLCGTTTTDASGVYAIDQNLATGIYVIDALRTGYIASERQSVSLAVGQSTTVDFALTPQGSGPAASSARITGRISDQVTGASVVGASVLAFKAGILQAQTTTAADGTYDIAWDLESGVYVIDVVASGYVGSERSGVSLTVGQTTIINFVLTPDGSVVPAQSARLTGRVTNAVTGAPVVGAPILAFQNGIRRGETLTGPTGTYVIDQGLPSGTYVVDVVPDGYVAQERQGVPLVVGQTTVVNFNPRPR